MTVNQPEHGMTASLARSRYKRPIALVLLVVALSNVINSISSDGVETKVTAR